MAFSVLAENASPSGNGLIAPSLTRLTISAGSFNRPEGMPFPYRGKTHILRRHFVTRIPMKSKKRRLRNYAYETLHPDVEPIDLKNAKREVKRLRALIATAKRNGDRRMKKYLQFVLETSPSLDEVEFHKEFNCSCCRCIQAPVRWEEL
jgi:hypothetical protein